MIIYSFVVKVYKNMIDLFLRKLQSETREIQAQVMMKALKLQLTKPSFYILTQIKANEVYQR